MTTQREQEGDPGGDGAVLYLDWGWWLHTDAWNETAQRFTHSSYHHRSPGFEIVL